MFLSGRLVWNWACLWLLVGGVLCTPAPARAAAKRCVQQNNDGADLRDRHRMLAARDAYRACIAERECPSMVRSECDAALTDLMSAIPTLLIAVLDDQGHDLPGAALLVDGKAVPLDGSSLEVDPGPHELVASSGALSSHLRLMAIEKDAKRRVEIVLRAPKSPEVKTAAARPALPVVRRSKTPVYLFGGVAALGAASFAYFALSGHSDLSDLDRCKPYCEAHDVDHVRREYLLADVSLGVSLTALAVAGYFLFSNSGAAPAAGVAPRSRGAPRVALGVLAERGAGFVSVRWAE